MAINSLTKISFPKIGRSNIIKLFLGFVLFVALILIAVFVLNKQTPLAQKTYSFIQDKVPLNSLSKDTTNSNETDNSLEFSQDLNTSSSYVKTIQKTDSENNYLNLNINNTAVGVYLTANESSSAVSANHKITYENIYQNVDFEYENFVDHIKETIFIKDAASPKEFSFYLKLPSTITLSSESDGSILASENGNSIFYIYPVTAQDATGKEVKYDYTLEKNESGYKLNLIPSQEVDFTQLVYPVIIDPTFTWTFGYSSDYTLSDSTKIEIAANVLRLKLNAGTYATDNPYAVTNNPVNFTTVSTFTETLGANNQGTVQYQLSPDKSVWYWWNGSTWTTASPSSFAQSNTATVVNAHFAAAGTLAGAGPFYVKAFLHAPTNTTPVELSGFTVTYTGPTAPSITTVSPSSGYTSGGTNITITGTHYVLPNSGGDTGWGAVAAKTLPTVLQGSSVAIVGNNIYAFGGYSTGYTNVIYTATIADPTTWSIVASKTLPANLAYASVAVIGSNVYLFGGFNGTTASTAIYRATTADPTTWTTVAGKTLPTGTYAASLAIVGNNIYLYGGSNATANTNLIYTATTADPTTWSNTGHTLPFISEAASIITVGNTMYLLGGNDVAYTGRILSASTSDPTTWTNTGKTIGGANGFFQIQAIGDYIYAFGGFTGSDLNVIYKAPISDPTTWSNTGFTLSTTIGVSQSAVINGFIYIFGGNVAGAVANGIYRVAITHLRPNVYNPTWLTNWSTTSSDQSNVYFGGVAATNIVYASTTSITATTPAHAAGIVDVVVTNYDGETATKTSGFTYVPPPTVSNITPTNVLKTGGTVTITGTGFIATPTVSIGGIAAASVTFVNSTTLTVTTAAQTVGIYNVIVTNSDGQTVTFPNAITFTELPPTVSSISPTSGFTAGGTNVTVTGTNFLAKNTGGDASWTTVAGKVLPSVLYGGQIAVINNNVYLFGGHNASAYVNTIYTATVADPTTWTNTGKTLPGNLGLSQLAIIGNNIYLFGGYNGSAATNVIYTATVADPTTWTTVVGKTLPVNLYGSQIAVIGGNIYLFGGNNGSYTNAIYTATVADPVTWTLVSGKTLPAALFSSQLLVVGSNVYLFGGFNGSADTNVIYTATVAAPTTWTNTGRVLPGILEWNQVAVVGDNIFLFGTFNGSSGTNAAYRSTIADPLTWTTAAFTIPSNIYLSHVAVIDNFIYLFGGTAPVSGVKNAIYRAPVVHNRGNVSNDSWVTNWPTVASDQSGITIGGVAVTNVNFVSSTSITATTGAHASGVVDVVALNYDGNSATLSSGYTYIPPPTISSVTPSSVVKTGGNSVTINGSNFSGTPTVTFGGIASSSVTFVNSTTLNVVTPAQNVGTYDVVVTNPDTQAVTLAGGISFTELPPTLSSITPNSGPTGNGTSVTITGTNFLPQVLGTGNDGAITVAANKNLSTDALIFARTCGDAISYSVTALTSNTATLLSIPTVACLSAGDEVLLINLQGTSANNGNVGNYETFLIQSIAANVITFTSNKTKFYGNASDDTNIGTATTNQRVMLQRVPNYSSVTVNSGIVLFANPWNGIKGGVLFFRVTGTVTNNGFISMAGSGYRGGAGAPGPFANNGYNGEGIGNANVQSGGPNAGGGSAGLYTGAASATGGGGAAYATAGANGVGSAANDGQGGSTYGTAGLDKLYMGSGGGGGSSWVDGTGSGNGGAGATGGGIVWVTANTISSSSGAFYAYGGAAGAGVVSGAGGGGGAGGSVYIAGRTVNVSTTLNFATGSAGGTGYGGFNGGQAGLGRVAIYYSDSFAGNFNPTPLITQSTVGSLSNSTISIGGNLVTRLFILNSTTATAIAQTHSAGAVDVVYTAGDGQTATLVGGFTYLAAPTVSSVSPSSVFNDGGKAITITGTNFNATPTVTIGGIAATSVTYVNSTTLTAVTPAHASGALNVVVTNPDAQSGTLTNGITFTDPPAAGTIYKLGFNDVSLTPLLIGQKSGSIIIKILDYYGTPVNVASNKTVYLNSDSSTDTFYDVSNNVITNIVIPTGSSQQQIFYKDLSPGTPTITISDNPYPDSPDAGLINDTRSITITNGNPTKISLSSGGSTMAVDVPQQITLTLLNDYDQAVPTGSTIAVTLGSSSSGGVFASTIGGTYNLTSINVTNGSSSTSFYYKDTVSGTPTVTASRSGFTSGTINFTLTSAGIYKILFNNSPLTVAAGNASSVYTIRFQDQFGNYTTTSSGLTINLATSDNTNGAFGLSSSGPWTATSVSVGSASSQANFYYKDTLVGSKTLTISATALVGDTQSVTIIANTAQTMQFVPNTSQTIVAQVPSSVITVSLFDQYGNVAQSVGSSQLNLTTNSSNAEFSATSTPWTPITSITIANSASQASFYYKDFIIGTPTITVASNTSAYPQIQKQHTITTGATTKLLITTSSQSAFTNTPTGIISFYTSDANNYQTQFGVDSVVTVNSGSAGGKFSIDSGSSWLASLTFNISANTSTSKSFIYVDSNAGSPLITISSSGLTSATQTQTITSASIQKLSFTGNSTVVASVPVALTIQTLNNSDQVVALAADTIFTLQSTQGTGQFSLTSSPFTPVTEVTISQFQNQKVVYYQDTIAGSVTLTVDEKVSQGWTAGTKSITVLATDYYRITLVQKPTSVVAEATSTVFTAQTLDQFGNVVSTGSRQIYAYGPASGEFSLDGSSNWTSTTLGITLADSATSGSFYYRDNVLGTKTITVSDQSSLDSPDIGKLNATASVDVLGQTPVALRVTSTAYTGGNKVTAGTYTGAITVQAFKANDTPAIVGSPFQINFGTTPSSVGKFRLTPSDLDAEITHASISTGNTSITIYFTSNVAGTHLMNFTGSGVTSDSQQVEFASAVSTKLVFLTSPGSSLAGVESNQMRVQLQDQFGNAATRGSDLVVSLTSTSVAGKFSLLNVGSWSDITQATLTTGNSDLYFYYKDTLVGTPTITADENPDIGLTSTSQTYTVTAGNVNSVVFTSSSNTLQAGQVSNVMNILLTDAFGNATNTTSTLQLYLYSSSNQGAFSASSGFGSTINSITINSGSSTGSFYYKDIQQNSPTITVSDFSTLDTPDVSIVNATQVQTITWGSVTKLQLDNAASSIQAGDPKLLQLRLVNGYNIEVPTTGSLTVYFHSTSGTGLFSLTTSFNPGDLITNYNISAAGTGVDVYYKDTSTGSPTVTISDVSTPPEAPDTGITNATQTFTVQSAAFARIDFISSAQGLVVGQTSAQITVQSRDIFGNVTVVDNSTPLYLYSTSGTGQFSLSTDFSAPSLITQGTINAGASTMSFYYKDSTYVSPGSFPHVKVSNQFPNPGVDDQIIDGEQIESITAGSISKMVLTPSTNLGTIIAGGLPTNVTVLFENQYNIEIPLTTNPTIYLFTTSSGGQFATWNGSSCGSFGITSVSLNSPNSRFTFCYKDSGSGSVTITVSDTSSSAPDTLWTNAVGTVTVDPGTITQLAFLNLTNIDIIARHPSSEIKIETRNIYGNPTNALSAVTVNLRSTSATGEFGSSPSGPWGISFITVLTGHSNASLYYRDSVVTSSPLTITASDNLPVTPDTGLTNATITSNILAQTLNNFLISNITDPIALGNPSNVTVTARDSGNFLIDSYTGTVTFSSLDSGAILPSNYTFVAGDNGTKTFTNSTAFSSTGEQWVQATDGAITGRQDNITVTTNSAGSVAKVIFIGMSPPISMRTNTASVPITLQIQDASNLGTNATTGGYPIRLTSTSSGGEFATSPSGPWSGPGLFSINENFSFLHVYYRDSNAGTPTITVSDWVGSSDNSGITNDTLAAIVNTLQIGVTTTLQVNNNSHNYVNSPIIFGRDEAGSYSAKVDFQISTSDPGSGQAQLSDLDIKWRDPSGNIVSTATPTNVSSYQFSVPAFQGTVASGNFTLDVIASAGGFNSESITNVPVSGWSTEILYDETNASVGIPLSFTINTKFNGVAADPEDFTVNFKDNNGNNVSGAQFTQNKADLTRTTTGVYTGQFDTLNLTPNVAYYLYNRVFDSTGQTLAEDNHHDIFFNNNPLLAPRNFTISKTVTSTAPAAETYDLHFTWSSAVNASKYILYRSRDKFTQLYQDPCTITQIRGNHRNGDTGATAPLCETTIQQHVGTDDSTEWVAMATINSPGTSYTLPWSQIQTDLIGDTYYYVIRSESGPVDSAYSTMAYTSKSRFNVSTVGNVNWVSMPFNSQYKKASDIVVEVEGSITGSVGNPRNRKINSISIWNPITQTAGSVFSYNTGTNIWTGSDFNINPGDGLNITLSGQTNSFDFLVSGNDTINTRTLNFNSAPTSNVNWISMPFTTKFRTASEVVTDLEGGLIGSVSVSKDKKISSISLWDPTVQGSTKIFYYNTNFNIWTGDDFTITPGSGLSIVLSGKGFNSFDLNHILVINPY
ncbi:MAG: IPT/TIG domain-containing protein [Candidatus Dojkabacteria bacterium]